MIRPVLSARHAFGPGQGDAPQEPVDVTGNLPAGLVLAATALALAPVVRALADRLYPERPVHFARWGFTHVLLGIPVGFAAAFLSLLVPGEGILTGLARTCLMTATVGAWAAVCAWRLDPARLGALGLRRARAGRAIAVGLAGYLLLLPAWMGVVFLWPVVATWLGIDVEPQVVLKDIVELRGTAALSVAMVLAIAVQPFLEELVFRGFLQPLLVQNLREVGGVVATSVLFGLLHGLSAFLPIFALSLFLGWVQLRTQRLFASWCVHAAHNGLVLAFFLH